MACGREDTAEQKSGEVSLGDAALALGALWSGETQIREHSTPETLDRALTAATRAATVRGARLAAALVSPIKRRVTAAERRLDALELEVRGPEPRMPRHPIEMAEQAEGVKVGDTFRRAADPTSVWEVTETDPDFVALQCGPSAWAVVPAADLSNTALWAPVRAVEAPPVRAEVGDRFEVLAGNPGLRAGAIVTVHEIDISDSLGDRWLRVVGANLEYIEALDALRGPQLYRPLPSAADRAAANPALAAAVLGPALQVVPSTEGETSDLHLPAGDERIGLTEAGARALGWAEDVKKLRDAWHAVPWDVVRAVDEEAAAFADVDRAIAALAVRAGLPLPSKLPVSA